MPSEEIKQCHMKCSIKIIEGRIKGEEEAKWKKHNRKVINMVDIRPAI